MNVALPAVVPTEREEYIAAMMLRAAWLQHVHRIAEDAWGRRQPVTLWPFDGLAVDAAAKELHVALDAARHPAETDPEVRELCAQPLAR